MINWYQFFMVAVAVAWVISTDRDRAAARIVLAATLTSHFIVALITHRISGAWKLVIPGAVETATIACLVTWARSRTGYAQALCLSGAWLAHLLCYIDIKTGADVVYSRYETILAGVAIAQLAAFYDTYAHGLRELASWAASLRLPRSGALYAPSVGNPVLRDSSDSRI